MTIEEKAKAYDEALERAKELSKRQSDITTMGYLFPELAESEDERIRKVLIDLVKCNERSGYKLLNDIPTSSMIAWLEKQGERVDSATVPHNYNVRDWIISKYGDIFQIKEIINESYKLLCPSGNEEINSIREVDKSSRLFTMLDIQTLKRKALNSNTVEEFKKQEEQKPIIEMKTPEESLGISSEEHNDIINECLYGESKSTDNVKPKFKVGDWIINNQGSAFLIAYINEEYQRYEFEIGGYTKEQMNYESIEFADKHYRLWTIQDAERGDILINGSNIFMFHFIGGTRVMGYCHVNTGNEKFYNDLGKIECFCLTDTVICPATKDQRDILLTKMNDAGYAWNEEEKRLVHFKVDKENEQNTEVGTRSLLFHKDDKDYEAIKLIKSAMVYCPYMESDDKKKVNDWLNFIQRKLS